MTKGLAYGILLVFIAISLCLMAARPDWIADNNRFLRDFVNHEFINVLGITLAVTLASAAQIHLAFNRIEEQHRVRNALEKSRAQLRSNVYWLISLFALGVAVVTVKPIASMNATGEAFFNMTALGILLCHVLIMTALTQLVFAIEPEFFDDDPGNGT
ncbi:MAG: hypothetical protein J0H65_15425 [Rhizobiales bacterium]|nr:hypothetical protein [Hyphomicrobiales bacterium]